MADVYEKNLDSKTSLTTSDFIRVVGSDNVSYKQLVSDVADKIITTYAGATLAGSAQSVKDAIDGLNSAKQPKTMSQTIGGQTTVEGCLSSLNSNLSDIITVPITFSSDITDIVKRQAICKVNTHTRQVFVSIIIISNNGLIPTRNEVIASIDRQYAPSTAIEVPAFVIPQSGKWTEVRSESCIIYEDGTFRLANFIYGGQLTSYFAFNVMYFY